MNWVWRPRVHEPRVLATAAAVDRFRGGIECSVRTRAATVVGRAWRWTTACSDATLASEAVSMPQIAISGPGGTP